MFRHFSPDGDSLQAQKLAYPFDPSSAKINILNNQ